jgi:hypothetical protein
MTVSGLTMQRAERHSAQVPQNQAHKHWSNRFSVGFFTERCSTPSWWSQDLKLQCRSSAKDRKLKRRTVPISQRPTAIGGNVKLPLYQADPNLREPLDR